MIDNDSYSAAHAQPSGLSIAIDGSDKVSSDLNMTTDQIAVILHEKFPSFAEWTLPAIQGLIDGCEPLQLAHGVVLINSGRTPVGQFIWLVLNGTLNVSKTVGGGLPVSGQLLNHDNAQSIKAMGVGLDASKLHTEKNTGSRQEGRVTGGSARSMLGDWKHPDLVSSRSKGFLGVSRKTSQVLLGSLGTGSVVGAEYTLGSTEGLKFGVSMIAEGHCTILRLPKTKYISMGRGLLQSLANMSRMQQTWRQRISSRNVKAIDKLEVDKHLANALTPDAAKAVFDAKDSEAMGSTRNNSQSLPQQMEDDEESLYTLGSPSLADSHMQMPSTFDLSGGIGSLAVANDLQKNLKKATEERLRPRSGAARAIIGQQQRRQKQNNEDSLLTQKGFVPGKRRPMSASASLSTRPIASVSDRLVDTKRVATGSTHTQQSLLPKGDPQGTFQISIGEVVSASVTKGQQRHYQAVVPAGATIAYCLQFSKPARPVDEVHAYINVGAKAGARLYTDRTMRIGSGISIAAPGTYNATKVFVCLDFTRTKDSVHHHHSYTFRIVQKMLKINPDGTRPKFKSSRMDKLAHMYGTSSAKSNADRREKLMQTYQVAMSSLGQSMALKRSSSEDSVLPKQSNENSLMAGNQSPDPRSSRVMSLSREHTSSPRSWELLRMQQSKVDDNMNQTQDSEQYDNAINSARQNVNAESDRPGSSFGAMMGAADSDPLGELLLGWGKEASSFSQLLPTSDESANNVHLYTSGTMSGKDVRRPASAMPSVGRSDGRTSPFSKRQPASSSMSLRRRPQSAVAFSRQVSTPSLSSPAAAAGNRVFGDFLTFLDGGEDMFARPSTPFRLSPPLEQRNDILNTPHAARPPRPSTATGGPRLVSNAAISQNDDMQEQKHVKRPASALGTVSGHTDSQIVSGAEIGSPLAGSTSRHQEFEKDQSFITSVAVDGIAEETMTETKDEEELFNVERSMHESGVVIEGEDDNEKPPIVPPMRPVPGDPTRLPGGWNAAQVRDMVLFNEDRDGRQHQLARINHSNHARNQPTQSRPSSAQQHNALVEVEPSLGRWMQHAASAALWPGPSRPTIADQWQYEGSPSLPNRKDAISPSSPTSSANSSSLAKPQLSSSPSFKASIQPKGLKSTQQILSPKNQSQSFNAGATVSPW